VRTFSSSSWPMLLVAALSIIFFVGGAVLEYESAQHGLKGLLQSMKEHGDLTLEMKKSAMDFQNERISRVHGMAAAAFDLAKIGLGAVVALATQHVTNAQRNAQRAPEA
jgi:hypothetical protein